MQFQMSKNSSLVATIWCPYLGRPLTQFPQQHPLSSRPCGPLEDEAGTEPGPGNDHRRASGQPSSYKIVIKNFLNPKGHQNPISGSKGTAILLKGWILPTGGASSRRVCACSLRSRLVSIETHDQIVSSDNNTVNS